MEGVILNWSGSYIIYIGLDMMTKKKFDYCSINGFDSILKLSAYSGMDSVV